MKFPLKNGFRGDGHGPFPLLIPFWLILVLNFSFATSGSAKWYLQPTEAVVVQLLRARCGQTVCCISQHSVENVEETPGDVEVAVGGQQPRSRSAICSFVQELG